MWVTIKAGSTYEGRKLPKDETWDVPDEQALEMIAQGVAVHRAAAAASLRHRPKPHPFDVKVYHDITDRIEAVTKSNDPRLDDAVRQKLAEAAHAIWQAWDLQSALESITTTFNPATVPTDRGDPR
ncbi:hypothetical protein OOZ54_12740 [Rhodopseudomonas palustris]|uniref:hypothetical protein n=1 Tax=Rhodopseudomonas palustris TaxID=1076 RepID=UPI0022F0876A|nr:hypothetical protein [Rhodopseudomonas palustris]WBU27562.1 hypothetical protein OOZ54_12740 [Rhodopseudomonas palustris]